MPRSIGVASLLAIIILLAITSLLRIDRPALAGQGKGGEIIAKPSPSPTNKPEPSRRNPAPAVPVKPQRKYIQAKFTNQYKMEFVLIPAGKFMMGSADGDESEKPIHGVTIGHAFYLGRYEVTQWQWRAVMGRTVAEQRRMVEPSSSSDPPRRLAGEGDQYPMYYVSWQEAHTFLQRLNALDDGFTYRLPSEAEWEYGCRAGSSGDRPADLNSIAWYKTNSNDSTQPVGMKRANAFGLYDMLGNVWEWCEDFFHSNYDGAPSDGSPWLATGDLNERIARGGSFSTLALVTGNRSYMRCAARAGETADYRDFETGFRVVAVARTQ